MILLSVLTVCFYCMILLSVLLTDFVYLYTYEFWLSLCKIVRSSVILLLPLLTVNFLRFDIVVCVDCEFLQYDIVVCGDWVFLRFDIIDCVFYDMILLTGCFSWYDIVVCVNWAFLWYDIVVFDD
jgi:hypothetical protein